MTDRPDLYAAAGALVQTATDLRTGADLVDDWSRHHAPSREARAVAELASGDLYAAAALIRQASTALRKVSELAAEADRREAQDNRHAGLDQ